MVTTDGECDSVSPWRHAVTHSGDARRVQLLIDKVIKETLEQGVAVEMPRVLVGQGGRHSDFEVSLRQQVLGVLLVPQPREWGVSKYQRVVFLLRQLVSLRTAGLVTNSISFWWLFHSMRRLGQCQATPESVSASFLLWVLWKILWTHCSRSWLGLVEWLEGILTRYAGVGLKIGSLICRQRKSFFTTQEVKINKKKINP